VLFVSVDAGDEVGDVAGHGGEVKEEFGVGDGGLGGGVGGGDLGLLPVFGADVEG